MLAFFASHAMDGKRQAYTRKRPGQKSGTDKPFRSPMPCSRGGPADYHEEAPMGMSQRGAPPPQPRRASRAQGSRVADYTEEVPIGMSPRGGPAPPPQSRQASAHHSRSRADQSQMMHRAGSHMSRGLDSRARRQDGPPMSMHNSHVAGSHFSGRPRGNTMGPPPPADYSGRPRGNTMGAPPPADYTEEVPIGMTRDAGRGSQRGGSRAVPSRRGESGYGSRR